METVLKFQKFKALVENQNGDTITCIWLDNGSEYMSRKSENLAENAIRHQTTVPYTLE